MSKGLICVFFISSMPLFHFMNTQNTVITTVLVFSACSNIYFGSGSISMGWLFFHYEFHFPTSLHAS